LDIYQVDQILAPPEIVHNDLGMYKMEPLIGNFTLENPSLSSSKKEKIEINYNLKLMQKIKVRLTSTLSTSPVDLDYFIYCPF
jgi:hypothetical protein